MFQNIFILAASLLVVIKGAIFATKYSVKLADNFRLSKYIVGFVIVSIISILPETLMFFNAAIDGNPAFGLGTLFGSNFIDLTLIFALIIAISGKNIKIEPQIIKNNALYPFILLIPLLLGLDGYYSRIEGVSLVIIGIIFYYITFKHNPRHIPSTKSANHYLKNLTFLILSIVALLIGAHFTVSSATNLASDLGIAPVLIGMLIVGIGTCIPELIFSIQAMKKHGDSLAVGDILGTVLADATIVVGLVSFFNPFFFPQKIVWVTGIFMLIAAFVLSHFMRTGRTISRREALLLFLFWIAFVLIEYSVNR